MHRRGRGRWLRGDRPMRSTSSSRRRTNVSAGSSFSAGSSSAITVSKAVDFVEAHASSGRAWKARSRSGPGSKVRCRRQDQRRRHIKRVVLGAQPAGRLDFAQLAPWSVRAGRMPARRPIVPRPLDRGDRPRLRLQAWRPWRHGQGRRLAWASSGYCTTARVIARPGRCRRICPVNPLQSGPRLGITI